MTDAFKLVQISQARRRQAATSVERSMPTQQEIEELFKERITPETDLPPMQPLFEMFDVPCFYRGELVADCGKAKSGKTFFLSIVMAGCLAQKALALKRYGPAEIISPAERTEITEMASQAKSLALTDDTDNTDFKPLRVLWIDTEQSQQSTQEILRDRIIPLAENNSPAEIDEAVYAFNLRGLGYDRRQKMVEVAVRAIKPDIVILDGIKDLMTDINDAVQATIIMEKLMALAKEQNCCIVCVLHQNKSEQSMTGDRFMSYAIGLPVTYVRSLGRPQSAR